MKSYSSPLQKDWEGNGRDERRVVDSDLDDYGKDCDVRKNGERKKGKRKKRDGDDGKGDDDEKKDGKGKRREGEEGEGKSASKFLPRK